jgi:hypothetical protein
MIIISNFYYSWLNQTRVFSTGTALWQLNCPHNELSVQGTENPK